MFQSFSPFGQMQGMGGMLQGQLFTPLMQQQVFPRRQQSASQSQSAPVVVPVVVVVNGTFVHTQAVAAASWTIDYPFAGQFPSVSVVDAAGKLVTGDVQYIAGLDRVIVTFAEPVAGKAFLNA